MNDNEREKYVINDEGLYKLQQQSKKSLSSWVKENRDFIDNVVRRTETAKNKQHFLIYG